MSSLTQEERVALLGQSIAMQVCMRCLVASNPGLDIFKLLLPQARKEALAFLELQTRSIGHLADFADVSLHMDHLLYVLTSGLFGENPNVAE